MSVDVLGSSSAPKLRSPSRAWLSLILACGLAIYLPTFRWLVDSWNTDRFYSHGYLVAAVCIWLAWRQKNRLARLHGSPDNRGIALVGIGLLLGLAGSLSDVMSLTGISLVMVIAGLILATRGASSLEAVGFPLFYFLFAVPLISAASDASGRVLTPMMEFATSATASFTDLIGLHPRMSGTIIRYPHYVMEVVVPCSGMASVVGLMALSALLAHLSAASWRRSVLLVASAVPVALLANIIRLSLTALLGVSFGEKVASGFLHELSGVFTFLLGAVIIICIPRGKPVRRSERPLQYEGHEDDDSDDSYPLDRGEQ